MQINQPQFKMRKPVSLTLDFLDTNPPKPAAAQIPEIDTFEEFCNNIPDNNQPESNSFESKQQKSEPKNESQSDFKLSAVSNPKLDSEASQIQYMVFEEFNPQSGAYSESIQSEKLVQESPRQQDLVKEPPAPCNKNNAKFSFPQKGGGLSGLKKQLQVAVPEIEQTNTSSYEQTILKLQQGKLNQNSDGELKQKISQLEGELETEKQQHRQQLAQISAENCDLKKQLEKANESISQLQAENEHLQQRLNQQESVNDKNQSECMSVICPSRMSDQDKISYLIEKLHQKSSQNAKLQYELIKLQNHVEMLTTKQMLQTQQLVSDSEQVSDHHSPAQFGFSQARGSKNYKEPKGVAAAQLKQAFLNLSGQQSQIDGKKPLNLQQQSSHYSSHIVSPLAKSIKLGNPPKNLTTHQSKTNQFKEDAFQNLKKMQSTKNSTSVGELNQIKPDFINCSNILQKIMRKDSHSTQSPDKPIQATQKFKETLNSKMQSFPDKQKSYASLLFSLGDFSKPRNQDAYIRQNSPHEDQSSKSQFKSGLSQRMGQLLHHNSRKQSETIKSEESHKASADQGKLMDKQYEYHSYHRKGKYHRDNLIDILQLMKDPKGHKIGISTKINYKKPFKQAVLYPRATITESKSSRIDKQNFD